MHYAIALRPNGGWISASLHSLAPSAQSCRRHPCPREGGSNADGWQLSEQFLCLGETWVAAGREVGGGHRREVVGGDTDGVDDLLVRADLVELRQTQAAPIFKLVGSCGAGCFAGGAGANQSSEVEILDSAGEHIAGRGPTAVDECDHGQVQ